MRLILIFILILSANSAFALDDTILNEKYPGFQSYLADSLVDMKTYFRSLLQNSVQYESKDGHRHLQLQNLYGNNVSTLDLLITREISENKIVEKIQYSTPNGSRFDIILLREGTNLKPTTDENFLLLNIYPDDTLTHFSLTFSQLNTQFEMSRNDKKERDSIHIGLFETDFLIETIPTSRDITRNYIVFFHLQPTPQSHLAVKALLTNSTSDEVNFIHFGTGPIGEVTPALFFEGLNEVNSLFKEFSNVSALMLINFGFPKI